MLKLTIELQTVTPLFLGGADPWDKPELRAASFRGVLRFWWRALMTSGENLWSHEPLRDLEASIWGSPDAASKIVLRTSGQPAVVNLERQERPGGVNYLFYGLHKRKRRSGRTVIFYRSAFSAGETLKLSLQVRPARKAALKEQGQRAFRQAVASLWLLGHLGGLGARMRRGAGALQIAKVDGDWPEDFPHPEVRANTPDGLCEELVAGLSQLRKALGLSSTQTWPPAPEFCTLRPDCSILLVLDRVWDDWDSALEAVGQSFREFRSRRPPDYDGVKEFIQTGTVPETVKRAAFGLPLPFYYRSLGGAKATVTGQSFDRSASPLRFRPVLLADGRVAVLVLLFISPLLPKGQNLQLSSAGYKDTASTPGPGMFKDYLKALGAKGQKGFIARPLEVKYV